MMWWIGARAAIEAAEALAAAEVVGLPEYRAGREVPEGQRKTERWAIPAETATSGLWAIEAYDGLTPEGVELVDNVDWPEVPEE